VAALYTEDALLLPPGADFISGRQAIQAFWQAVMNSGVRGVQLETVELAHYGQALQEIGRYTLTGAGGQVLDRGKYIVIWRHDGPDWQIHRDIFNSSLPPS
jgi:ketosteroid isomerase-like protein